jgi:hypothetical protein
MLTTNSPLIYLGPLIKGIRDRSKNVLFPGALTSDGVTEIANLPI